MRARSLRLVEVTWHDAWQDSGWSDDDKEVGDNDPHVCRSIGLVVHDTQRGLTLAGAISPTGDRVGWGHKQFIPRGMVVEVREIERVRVNFEK